jgi:hypothetical protein
MHTVEHGKNNYSSKEQSFFILASLICLKFLK